MKRLCFVYKFTTMNLSAWPSTNIRYQFHQETLHGHQFLHFLLSHRDFSEFFLKLLVSYNSFHFILRRKYGWFSWKLSNIQNLHMKLLGFRGWMKPSFCVSLHRKLLRSQLRFGNNFHSKFKFVPISDCSVYNIQTWIDKLQFQEKTHHFPIRQFFKNERNKKRSFDYI